MPLNIINMNEVRLPSHNIETVFRVCKMTKFIPKIILVNNEVASNTYLLTIDGFTAKEKYYFILIKMAL